jgi:tetrapyrrole methylase family protein/MazG family protein
MNMDTQRITIVGLGPGALALVSLQTLEVLRAAPCVILRTARHPAAEELPAHDVRFTACDDLYDTHDTFEAVYGAIVARVLDAAARCGAVAYAVPGDPLAAERTVQMLLDIARERRDLQVEVLPALGVLNLVTHRLRLDPGDGLRIADARDPQLRPTGEAPAPDEHPAFHGAVRIDPTVPTVWLQVDTPMVASNLKVLLLEQYPPEHPVTVLTALGSADEAVATIPLAELDRGTPITHLTSLYVPALPWQARRHTIVDIRAIMALLRSDRGCPWDRDQDFRSIRRTVIEEAYEVVEAIDRDDPMAMADELGDLLLNVVFLAQLGAEEGIFDFDDVLQALGEKLIRRHAHVFGDVKASSAAAALRSWEHIKAGERTEKGHASLLDDVPHALPALARSQKLQNRAARVGFDWPDFTGPLGKIHEELGELSQEIGVPETWELPPALREPLVAHPELQRRAASAPKARLVHEAGDILTAVVNLCRFLKLDAEEVLREANNRFARRFARLEAAAADKGLKLQDMTLEQMDELWVAIKGDD